VVQAVPCAHEETAVDEHPDVVRDPGVEPAEDYGYDLAHEAPAGRGAGHAEEPGHDDRHSIYVTTQTDDQGGDYGYDLAHDVPPR
jgi:hypothetical protein